VIFFNIILIENNQLEGPIPLTLGDINGLREFIASKYLSANEVIEYDSKHNQSHLIS